MEPPIYDPANTIVFLGPDIPGQQYHATDYVCYYYAKGVRQIYYVDDKASYEDAVRRAKWAGLKYPQVIYHYHSREGSLYFYQGDPDNDGNRLSYKNANYGYWLLKTASLYPGRVNIIGCDFYKTPDADRMLRESSIYFTYVKSTVSFMLAPFYIYFPTLSVPVSGCTAHIQYTTGGILTSKDGAGSIEEYPK